MEITHHRLFPTLVSEFTDFEHHAAMKEVFWKNHKQHAFKDDPFTAAPPEKFGMILSHADEELSPLFENVISCAKGYVHELGADVDLYYFTIVKSFVSTNDLHTSNTPHRHGDAHISFIYYIYVPSNINQRFCVHDTRHRFEPFEGFIQTQKMDKSNWSDVAADFWSFAVKEGNTIIIPSNLTHSTSFCDERDNAVTQIFEKNINELDDLKQMRIAIAGDIILHSKGQNTNPIGLQPMNLWRHYG